MVLVFVAVEAWSVLSPAIVEWDPVFIQVVRAVLVAGGVVVLLVALARR